MRIAVLSDMHIDSEVAPESWILAKRAFKTALAQKPDHVVIAGDLFDSSGAMLRDKDRVEQYLRRIGLWTRDLLTIVVGNHDIYRTPHRGSRLSKAKEFLTARKAQDSYETFCEWAAQLVNDQDRLAGEDDLYPNEKRLGHVRLWVADTTSSSMLKSGNGYWRIDDDKLLRESATTRSANERRILAIHNSPFRDQEQSLGTLVAGDFALGFPHAEYRRLRRFVDVVGLEAIVCGHIHALDEADEWSWPIGKGDRCLVHMVGRTGGLHDETPCLGLLQVPTRGALRWKTIEVS